MDNGCVMACRWRIGAVVVVYQPELQRLRSLLQRLAGLVSDVVMVNNGTAINSTHLPDNVYVLAPGRNLGVAAALNMGVRCLETLQCTHAWSFDQDSLPSPACLEELIDAWRRAPLPERLAAVAPGIGELGTASPLPFLVEGTRGEVRQQVLHAPAEVMAAITSGLLFRIDVWSSSGGALEPLFIDHVDTEWCYRIRCAGWRIMAVPSARVDHQLGERGPRLAWLGPTVVVRPPLRTYFMLRNGWLLGRARCTPSGWRRYQWRQAFKIVVVALLYGPQRWGQFKAVVRALRDARANPPWMR